MFNGSPYQPIPVTEEATKAMALPIMERREEFRVSRPNGSVVREYPAVGGQRRARPRLPGAVIDESLDEVALYNDHAAERATRRCCRAPT